MAHQSESLNEAGNTENQFEMPAWTVLDGAIGIAKDAWRLELYVHNMTDENKSTFTTNRQFIVAEIPMRPRTITLRMGYDFVISSHTAVAGLGGGPPPSFCVQRWKRP